METEDQENTSMKDLREAAERGRKASSELDAMKREMAFLKAGVDLEKKAGQLLMKAYDGDLEPELIRAEAEELGAITGAAPTPVEEAQEIDTSTLATTGQWKHIGISKDPSNSDTSTANVNAYVVPSQDLHFFLQAATLA